MRVTLTTPKLVIYIVVNSIFLISNIVISSAKGNNLGKSVEIKHNPFISPAYISTTDISSVESITEENIKINGVLLNGTDSLIIINGHVLGLKDEIEGYQLIELSNKYAVFKKNGKLVTYALPGNDN